MPPRLAAIASFVRPGALLVDVGTDHAWLPLYLLRRGRVARAIATDLREGPLAIARCNAEECGDPTAAKKLTFLLGDGLAPVEPYLRPLLAGAEAARGDAGGDGLLTTDFGKGELSSPGESEANPPGAPPRCDPPRVDIVLAGMGGETIAGILERAPWVRSAAVQLLLSPMTRSEAVRGCLARSGFLTTQDTLVRDSSRLYEILAAVPGFAHSQKSAMPPTPHGDSRGPDERPVSPQPAELPRDVLPPGGAPAPGSPGDICRTTASPFLAETPLTPLELRVGARRFWGNPIEADRRALIERHRARALTSRAGKARAGLPHDAEDALLAEIDAALANG